MTKYFISFVEECVMNPLYLDYIAGRMEVSVVNEQWPRREIRFFTRNVRKFRAFREYWDMQDVTGEQLGVIERKVKREFYQFPKKVNHALS